MAQKASMRRDPNRVNRTPPTGVIVTHVAPTSTYGAAGSLVLVLFWVYYSSLILFFGTCLAKIAILYRDGAVTPKQTAVRTNVVVQEE